MSQTKTKKKYSLLSTIIMILCIIAIFVLLKASGTASRNNLSAANGIIAQLNVLICTILVVSNHKRGFLFCLLYNIIYGAFLAIVVVGIRRQTTAAPGVVTCLFCLITAAIIYFSWKQQQKMNDQLNESYNKQIETNNIMRQKDEKLMVLAYTDMLTGLANRAKFNDVLDEYMGANQPFYIVCANIDNFRAINDNFGHNIGDAMLIHMSELFTQVIGENGLVARIGGDDFAIVMRHQGGDMGILQDIEQLRNMTGQPFAIDGNMFGTTMSFGIAAYPQQGATAEEVFIAADTALYTAKYTGKNRTFFASQGSSYYNA